MHVRMYHIPQIVEASHYTMLYIKTGTYVHM